MNEEQTPVFISLHRQVLCRSDVLRTEERRAPHHAHHAACTQAINPEILPLRCPLSSVDVVRQVAGKSQLLQVHLA